MRSQGTHTGENDDEERDIEGIHMTPAIMEAVEATFDGILISAFKIFLVCVVINFIISWLGRK